MYEVDGGNEQMLIMDKHRGTILSFFGQPGRQQGQFTFLHTVSIDSRGNMYTGETVNGRRIQKFVPVKCDDDKKRDRDRWWDRKRGDDCD